MLNNKTSFMGLEICDEPIEYWVDFFVGSEKGPVSIVVTPNVDHFSRLSSSKPFSDAYDNSDYIFCDSRIIQKVSYITGEGSIENVVPGSDLTEKIFKELSYSQKKVCVIGSSPDELAVVRDKYLVKNFFYIIPSFGFINNEREVDSIVSEVVSSNFDLVFIAVGSPQQEFLAVKIKKRFTELAIVSGPFLFCVGASIDFISGKTKRANVFFQRAHLEWLHRALSDPRRLIPRYWKNFLWLSGFVLNKLILRR